MKEYYYKYDTVSEFVDRINSQKVSKLFIDNGRENRLASVDGSEEFTYTESYEVANKLMEFGDKDMANKINEMADAVDTDDVDVFVQSIKAKNERSFVGSMPHVPSYLVGNPRNMIRKRRIPTDTKIINIVYNCSIDCGQVTDDMIKVGAKILYCLKEFEKAGYSVNLYMSFLGRTFWGSESNAKSNDEVLGCVVKIKDSGQYMDIEKLAYLLANPSFFRRHYFRFIETEQTLKKNRWTGGYGYIYNDKEAIKKMANKLGIESNVAVVEYYQLKGKTPKETSELIKSINK